MAERFPLPEQIWFDANQPSALHDALRNDFARARAAVNRRPSLRRHFEECPSCQAIAAAVAGSPGPTATRKRLKMVITPELMHELLNLPANFEIVHMFAEDDPNLVSVLVAGEGLPEVASGRETPIVSPETVAGTARSEAF
jgi:hypothetical protein